MQTRICQQVRSNSVGLLHRSLRASLSSICWRHKRRTFFLYMYRLIYCNRGDSGELAWLVRATRSNVSDCYLISESSRSAIPRLCLVVWRCQRGSSVFTRKHASPCTRIRFWSWIQHNASVVSYGVSIFRQTWSNVETRRRGMGKYQSAPV